MCWTAPQSPPHACAYVSEDKWLGPPLPRPRLHTPIRTGAAPEPDRHQRPSKRGAGESASSTPAQHWARQAAWSLAAWALWRTWRGVAQSTHGSSQLHTPARTPVVADSAGLWPPDPPSHTRAIAGQGWSFHKHRGRVGWLGALGPRGGHQQAAQQSVGENEGVGLERPLPLDTANHHTSAERARAAQHQHSTDGAGSPATVRHRGVVQGGGPAGEKTRSASSAASRASTTPLSHAVDAKCIRKWGRR